MKFGVVTLGCDKNTVDSERYLAELVDRGAEYTAELDEAEVILVNTCGFIDTAKRESIDALLEAGRRKTAGSCRAVVAVGCLVERHREQLAEELPEVDLFLGASDMHTLIPVLAERGMIGESLAPHPGVRLYMGDLPHVRYLKISEGCDHGCAFCAIPLMRGKHRSFDLGDVVREAQLLEMQGARELNLVAQDLAHYGRDLRGGPKLPDLLDALLADTGVPWLRLLYLYSAGITPRLLELMAREPRVLPYLDMPIQHASDRMLERMRRPERKHTIRERVRRMREVIPDVAIRTTCIVGFPGETESDFDELLDFLEEVHFERVGAFAYSPQEGTRAATLPDDVPDSVKLDRLDRLGDVQGPISAERYERHVGRTVRVLVDRVVGTGAEGRTVWQADDVDGITRVAGSAPAGSFVDVVLEHVIDDVDYTGRLVRVDSVPARRAARPGRALPVVTGIARGSYGR
jgi:ribosomal protein S12 methylthiotransferase